MKIDKWSYSRLRHFTNIKSVNEKMEFLRREPEGRIEDYGKSSSAPGIAYHEALAFWLTSKKLGAEVSLENIKIIEKIKTKRAQGKFKCYLMNFINNKGVYEKYLENSEIVDVERSFTERISIGAIAPQVPCEGRIDLIIKDPDNEDCLIVIDHKTSAFKRCGALTSDTWQPFISTLLVEKGTGKKVSKVIQIENNIAGKPDFIIRIYGMGDDDRKYYFRMIKNSLNEFLRMAEAA